MPTIFVTASLLLVMLISNNLFASQDECLDIKKQSICYDIEGTEDAAHLELKQGQVEQSMLISKDLAQSNVKDLMVVSSDLIKMEQKDMQTSVYDHFTKADELYYRFAYKILDKNNRETTVVITRD